MKEKITKLENMVNELSLQKDSVYNDNGLFPNKITEMELNTERNIRDSFLEKKVDDLRTSFLQM